MTTKQIKLKELLAQLDNFGKPLPKPPSFQMVKSDDLSELNSKIDSLDINPIIQLVKDLQQEIVKSEEILKTEFENRIASVPDLTKDISKLQVDFKKEVNSLREENRIILKDLETKLMAIINTANTLDTLEDEKEKEATQAQFAAMDKEFKKLRQDVTRRGGSMYPTYHEEYPLVQTVGLTNYTFKHTIGYITLAGQKQSVLQGDYTQSGEYRITLANADPVNLPINNYF